MKPSHLALAVPVFNGATYAPSLSAAVADLEPRPGWLLALDDGSSDDSGELLRGDGFEVLRRERNGGLGAARNRLWREAASRGARAILFLDVDVEPPPDLVGRVAAALGRAGPTVAGVGGQNLDPEEGPLPDRWRGRYWAQSLGPVSLDDAPMLVGALAAYRVAALESIGGFDESFRSHGEDVHTGRRLRRAGWTLRYDPSLCVRHLRRDTAGSLVRAAWWHCREGMRATRDTPGCNPTPAQLVTGMTRKALRAPAGALWRRRDPAEALLAAATCGAGLSGYLVALADPGAPRPAPPLAPEQQMSPDLSILIFTRDDADALSACLASLRDDPLERSHEIIVFDNASSDGTADVVSSFTDALPLRTITSPGEISFSAGNNAALADARGRFVLFLNPDTVLNARALGASVELLERQPDAGLVSPILRYPGGRYQPNGWALPTPRSLLRERLRRAERMQVLPRGEPTTDVGWLLGCFLMGPRQLLADLGGFDEDYWFHGTDLELCARVGAAGYRVVRLEGVEIEHEGQDGWPTERFTGAREALSRFLRREHGPLAGAGAELVRRVLELRGG